MKTKPHFRELIKRDLSTEDGYQLLTIDLEGRPRYGDLVVWIPEGYDPKLKTYTSEDCQLEFMGIKLNDKIYFESGNSVTVEEAEQPEKHLFKVVFSHGPVSYNRKDNEKS